jgi:hypothetical protein
MAMIACAFFPTGAVAQYYDREVEDRIIKGHADSESEETNERIILYDSNKIINGQFSSMYIRYHGCM